MRSHRTWYIIGSTMIFSLLMLSNHNYLEALPSVKNVAHGQANVTSGEHEMLIEASDRAIINYRHFDIQSHESVRFQMADASHRILNRVQSDLPSHIDGKLFSNGIVYLINPAGILFGPHSVVDVTALFAAAGHLSDRDFFQGIDHFKDVQGPIEIHGILTAQEIALIGKTILQKGQVLADDGHILFATAENVYIGREEGHLFLKCDKQLLQAEDAVVKKCFLECGTPESLLLHHAGVSKAKTIHLYAGKDSLVHVEGHLDVTNLSEKGGDIRIQGEVINLVDAHIDASGAKGGGTVLIGGGEHGQGMLPTAKYTTCDPKTAIFADATHRGDGGKIILWADEATLFDAMTTARGGEQGGNGGFIETSSGHNFRSIVAKVDTSAPQGKWGLWALDPHSITIRAGADVPAGLALGPPCVPAPTTCDGTTGDYFITPTTLQTAVSNILLAATVPNPPLMDNTFISLGNSMGATPETVNITNPGVGVTINTQNGVGNGVFFANGSFSTTGFLVISSPVVLKGNTTFTSGTSNIDFGFTIDSDVSAVSSSLTLNAPGGVIFTGSVGGSHPLIGNLTINAPGSNIQTPSVGPSTIAASGDITFNSAFTTLNAACAITSSGGGINFLGQVNSDTPSSNRNLTLSAVGDILFHSFVGLNPVGDLTIINAHNVELLSQPNPTLPVITMRARSFTQLAGTGETHFEGTLFTYGNPVPQAGGTPPTPPANGGDVSITTAGDINFYYLVQQPPSTSLVPVLVPAPTDIVADKSVITTTGGRQSSSVPTVGNPNAPNGLRGGNVSLNGNSINLLAVYAGGTPAFPGTSGTGGSGGNIDIRSVAGTALRGPLIGTGGAGAGGGAEDLPTLLFAGQNLNASGVGSPGNITIAGPLTLGFNGIIMRGSNVTIGDIQSSPSNLLGIDASTASAVQLGELSNLSYFVVDYAKGVLVTGPVQAAGLDLYNAGSNNIVFQQPVTSTDIQQIANRFCVIYEQGFTASTETFLNCGCPPTPPPPGPPPSPEEQEVRRHGRGFAGVWFPSFDVFYYPGYVFYSKDDIFLYVPQDAFFLNYIIPHKITDRLK